MSAVQAGHRDARAEISEKHNGQSRFSGGSPGRPRLRISLAWSNAFTRANREAATIRNVMIAVMNVP